MTDIVSSCSLQLDRLEPTSVAAIPDSVLDMVIEGQTAMVADSGLDVARMSDAKETAVEDMRTWGRIQEQMLLSLPKDTQNLTSIVTVASTKRSKIASHSPPDNSTSQGDTVPSLSSSSLSAPSSSSTEVFASSASTYSTSPSSTSSSSKGEMNLSDPKSQVVLGNMYKTDDGVAQDFKAAVFWYRKAAEQWDVLGQQSLGFMYDNGWGVTQDRAEAIVWYLQAADQGDSKSQFYVGSLLYSGDAGVQQDYTKAMA